MSRKYTFSFLFIILLLGFALRFYNHHQWLFFKWDQGRDAILLAPAVKYGPEHLPLLGPRATKIEGDYLRLGPAYYYVQYLTAKIFRSVQPPVFAYSDLFFGVLTIWLLYLFLHLYFSRSISLLGALFYSLSFLAVQYSRFSWNPNSVPFFTLLTFYSLLRFAGAKTFKSRLGWLSLWALAFAVASQYHFFAFFVLTFVSASFFVFYFWREITTFSKKKDFFSTLKFILSQRGLRYLLRKIFSRAFIFSGVIILLIFAFVYSPVIISDYKTGASNTKLFFKMFSESGRADKTFTQKLLRNFRQQGDNFCLLTTGFKHRAGHKNDPLTVGFGLALLFSFWLILKKEWELKRNYPEKFKFYFPVLLFIWSAGFFLITIPASYQLRPRYFVPVFTLPAIILTFWLSLLDRKLVKHNFIILLILTLLASFPNIYNLGRWFKEQKLSQEHSFKTYHTLILKHRDGVTLGQLERARDYLIEEQNNSPSEKLYYNTPTEYYLPFIYLLAIKNKNEKILPVRDLSELAGKRIIYVINTGADKSAGKQLRPFLRRISYRQFGQLFVHKMTVVKKEELQKRLAERNRNLATKGDLATEKKTKRLFWRDIFGTDDDLDEILIKSK